LARNRCQVDDNFATKISVLPLLTNHDNDQNTPKSQATLPYLPTTYTFHQLSISIQNHWSEPDDHHCVAQTQDHALFIFPTKTSVLPLLINVSLPNICVPAKEPIT
jgi:hypothetical protein